MIGKETFIWKLTFVFISVILIILLLLILVEFRTGSRVCEGVDAYLKSDLKGVALNNGVLCFDYYDGVGNRLLFHEACHFEVADDYNHFCVEGYEDRG